MTTLSLAAHACQEMSMGGYTKTIHCTFTVTENQLADAEMDTHGVLYYFSQYKVRLA